MIDQRLEGDEGEGGVDALWWDRIADAAVRVAEQLTRELPEGTDRDDIPRRLAHLVRALRFEDGGHSIQARSAFQLAMYQRLLDRLFHETLQDWSRSRAPGSQQILHLLRAFERVRESIVAHETGQYAFLWAVPHGADLLVELAHDLRSPLTSIIFLAESLRQGQSGNLTALQRRQIGIIYAAALNLVSMASDVIELARGSMRLMERNPTPFSVVELLESVENVFEPVIEERRISFRRRGPVEDQRLGHPVALSRVLVNLTSNALRHTEEGYVEVSVVATGPTRVQVSVEDTGPGLEVDGRTEMFEPLRKNPRSNRIAISGSGLGLVICRRLVEAMGGTLRYRSAPGQGTRFFFDLELPPIHPT